MKRKYVWTACLVSVAFAFTALTAQGDNEKLGKKQCTASEIIGKKVTNVQDEDLGKIQDIVINAESGYAPYAIVSSGFAGRSRTAVPFESLQPSSDGKSFMLNATKEDLKNASKTPGERWAVAENAEWAKNIDGYYGQPMQPSQRFDRQRAGDTDSRVFTRDPAPKGAERLMQPADRALCEKVCDALGHTSVEVENGVAHLYGTVESDAERRNIETKVRAVEGVQRVESHLKVKNSQK